MAESTWIKVDEYFSNRLIDDATQFNLVLENNALAGLPAYDVTPLQAKFLQLLARSCSAKRILEIGTLGGFSTIWLAHALPPSGSMTTLEINPDYAKVAQQNFERFGVSEKIQIVVGEACRSLARLHAEDCEPFDFVFIDADKTNNREYFHWALQLTNNGAVILIDNVVRNGDVLDPSANDPSVLGVQSVVEAIRDEPTVTATAIQTVGDKGYDGFLMAVVDRSQR